MVGRAAKDSTEVVKIMGSNNQLVSEFKYDGERS